MIRWTLASVVGLTALAGCEGVPKAQYYANAMMPLMVTDAPVAMASGPLKMGDVIGLHTVTVSSGAVLGRDVVGVTRPVPAGTVLAEGLVAKQGGRAKLYCDVRPTDAFSTYHEVDCFEDTNADGAFDAIWTGRPSLSMTLFTLSLSSAGYQGTIEPIAYQITDKAPQTEIGFATFICWNSQPAFLLSIRRLSGAWETATGPCGVGDHPGEISKGGIFSVSGAQIRVTGEGEAATFDLIKRIPPGPISILTQRLQLQRMKLNSDKRKIMTLTGAIPAIAISAGLLSLEPDSALRQEYWPWLPLVVLAIGMGSSAVFWLLLAPRRGKQDPDS